MKTGNAKVIYSQMVSLDGFMETRDGNIDWSVPGQELFQHSRTGK